MEYTVIRSRRKTISMEVRPDLTVVVRAPLHMTKDKIEAFVRNNREWLKGAVVRTAARSGKEAAIDTRERELRAAAKAYLPGRTAYWAKIMGVTPTGVKITSARGRFGSCSGKNSICYSWRLMAYPQEAVDYVVVHELAHILQKNHSARFYAVVERYLPDWRERQRMLKK